MAVHIHNGVYNSWTSTMNYFNSWWLTGECYDLRVAYLLTWSTVHYIMDTLSDCCQSPSLNLRGYSWYSILDIFVYKYDRQSDLSNGVLLVA